MRLAKTSVIICSRALSNIHRPRMDVRLCVFLLVLGGASALTGKGLFCRDPDTGKLYPANSTWKSTSFCGNYTCRLKKKDLPTKPIREFKVSELDASIENNTTDITDPEQNNQLSSNVETNESRMTTLLNKLKDNITDNNDKNIVNGILDEANKHDRYLNEREIKIIADMLQSVKKSDLETVVDIYNIAQDIYKELDKKDELSEDAEPQIIIKEQEKPPNSPPNRGQNKLVYGFAPVQLSQKVMTEIKNQETGTESYEKMEHNLIPEQLLITNKSENIVDMHTEGSELEPRIYNNPKTENSVSNYKSPLTIPSFVRMPYYYDLSDFHRYSSYVYPRPLVSTEKVSQVSTENSIRKPKEKKSDKAQYSLLPYPYYQVRYNATGFPYSYFYSVNPYQDVYKKEYNPYYVSRASYSEGKKPENAKMPAIFTTVPPETDSVTKAPSWKTDSLSDDVIDEIRAHFESKNILFKPLCLKKKIKLEKVGKVFKWDDGNREKRSTVKNWPLPGYDDNYEVFIEKIICKSDVDPGYFRMGNTSASYPACCPQRIRR